MTQVKHLLAPLLLLVTLAGCSSVSVESDHLQGVDFSMLKTYRWHAPNEFNQSSQEYLNNDIIDKRVKSNVDSVLASKGYVKTESGAVDFLVNYSIATEDRMDIQTYNNYNGFAPGYGYGGYHRRGYYYSGVGMGGGVETRTTYYTQGTFILDVVRPEDDKLIWRGTAEGKVNQEKSATKKEQNAHEVATAILEDFPPEPR